MSRSFLLVCLLHLALTLPVLTREQTVRFDQMGFRDGLVNSSISSIVQDRDGFLWFGSQAGLHRYDGYSMRVKSSTPFDPDSLTHHLIQTLYYDNNDYLWIGTYGGLNILDSEDYSMITHVPDRDATAGLSDEVVTAITQDAAGDYWIGTLSGLNRLPDRTSDQFETFMPADDNQYSLPHQTVRAVYSDSRERLWVGTYGGISLVQVTESDVLFNTFSFEHGLAAKDVMAITEDDEGTLWIGTWNGGLHRFNETKRRFEPVGDIESPIYTIVPGQEGQLYIGSWGGGLYHYFPGEPVRNYRHNPQVKDSLAHNIVYSLFLDDTGILWVGTNGNGISKFNTKQREFTLIDAQRPGNHSMTAARVRTLLELPDGDLLIGFKNAGIERYRPGQGIVQRYSANQAPAQLNDNNINDFLLTSDGTVLVATNRGLQQFDYMNRQFHTYNYHSNPYDDADGEIIYALAEDADGAVWIGTYARGVVRRLPDGTLHRFERDAEDLNSLSNNLVYEILVDSRNTVWVATNGGLNRYDRVNNRWKRYEHNPSDASSISSNSVSTLFEDSMGRLWIGTRAGGLNLYDPLRDAFFHWTVQDGLSSNTIMALAESLRGELLLATANGLHVFLPEQDLFYRISEADGMPVREFASGVLRSPDGRTAFGAFGRIIQVDDTMVEGSSVEPATIITDIQVQNTSIDYANANRVDKLTLTFRENWLAFWFAASDFVLPHANTYRVRLQGFDTDWQYIGTRRFAEYTNIPPGKYRFQVQAANSFSVWDSVGRTVDIHIQPPFWQTLFFRIVLMLGLFAIVVWLHRCNTNRLRRINNRLDEQIRQRTRELTERNQDLAEANIVKSRFFSILAQDLREPVNGLVGYTAGLLEQVKQNRFSQEDAFESLSVVCDTAEGVQHLLENVLEWGELQDTSEPVVLEAVAVNLILQQSVGELRELIKSKDIQIDICCPQDLVVSASRQTLAGSIHNLLHNAVKNSAAGEKVELSGRRHPSIRGMAVIEVVDQGGGNRQLNKRSQLGMDSGIPGAAAERNSDLGLALCREQIESIGGSLAITSVGNAGTRATIQLPMFSTAQYV